MLVLDRAPLPEASAPLGVTPELRVSTLTPASVRLFCEAGAWDDMAPPRSAPFQHMQVHMIAGLQQPLYTCSKSAICWLSCSGCLFCRRSLSPGGIQVHCCSGFIVAETLQEHMAEALDNMSSLGCGAAAVTITSV